MNDRDKEQMPAISDSSKTYMLNTNAVWRLAVESGYRELGSEIDEHRPEYWHFIVTNEE